MIEATLGFFVGVLTSWWALVALIALATFSYSDDTERTLFWPLLGGILVALSVYLIFDAAPWQHPYFRYFMWGYFPVGIAWSLFKYRKFCKYQLKGLLTDGKLTKDNKYYYDRYTKPSKNVGRISHWIFFWPFSVLGWLLTDFVTDVTTKIVDSFLRPLFERIRDSIVKDVEIIEDEPDERV